METVVWPNSLIQTLFHEIRAFPAPVVVANNYRKLLAFLLKLNIASDSQIFIRFNTV